MKTLERKLTGGLGGHRRFDGGLDLAVDQDLPVLGIRAQPSREIDHRADGAVVEPALEADAPERGISMRDADAEAELMALLAPLGR